MPTFPTNNQLLSKTLYCRGNAFLWREPYGPTWVFTTSGLVFIVNTARNSKVSVDLTSSKPILKLSQPITPGHIYTLDLLCLDVDSYLNLSKNKRRHLGLVKPNYCFRTHGGYVVGYLTSSASQYAEYDHRRREIKFNYPQRLKTSQSIWHIQPPMSPQRNIYVDWYIKNVVLARSSDVSTLDLYYFVRYGQQYLNPTVKKILNQQIDRQYQKLIKKLKVKPSEANVKGWSKQAAQLGKWEYYANNDRNLEHNDLAWFHAVAPSFVKPLDFEGSVKALVPLVGGL